MIFKVQVWNKAFVISMSHVPQGEKLSPSRPGPEARYVNVQVVLNRPLKTLETVNPVGRNARTFDTEDSLGGTSGLQARQSGRGLLRIPSVLESSNQCPTHRNWPTDFFRLFSSCAQS